jgi:tRNA threonylcarbamoyladenosine biosynthesis protein TsaB
LLTFALDTSTPSPSLALLGDAGPVAELWLGPDPAAGRRVLEAVHHLLCAARAVPGDLGRIVVGVGPGGFTGLRIGIATAQALGQALGCPVVGVISLEALAMGAAEGLPTGAVVVAAHDARRHELFAASYAVRDGDGLEEHIAPIAIPAIALADRLAPMIAAGIPVVAVGSGARVGRDALTAAGVIVPPPAHAAHRLRAALLVARIDAGTGRPPEPVYTRLPDAEVARQRAAAL